MLTIRMNGSDNVFRKNTIHKTGASATVKIGNSALVEYNNIYDTGHLQSDGSMIQFTEAEQDGAICRYNWLHDTEKYGARFDHSGTADGTNGTMHHNVAWNCESGGIMVKGNNHQVYNNTVLNSGSKNDIIVFQVNSGDHSNTIVKNNAADKIANHRVNDVEINFGTYTNNWNGYKESITLNSILEDTSNGNFSPTLGSPLIDAGTIVSNITDQYTNNGTGPDIGAYERGNTNWTAGHDWDLGSTFGNNWVPMHNLSISGNSGFRMMSSPVSGTILVDLLDELWLQGMTDGDIDNGNSNIWFLDLAGQSWSPVNNITNQSLSAGQGFLVYVFEDCDNDGDNDLPVDLFVSGNHNQSNVTISSVPQNSYYLAGNPYTKTIDWDNISKTNLSAVISVWDDASSDWKTYNGTSGDLTNGLIAPFQGFWIQALGGVGSMTIQTDDIATSSTSFIRNINRQNNFISLSVFNENKFDNIYFTFDSTSSEGYDAKDAIKLVPLSKSARVAAMIINDNKAFKINSLPSNYDSTMIFPLQILSLGLDSVGNYIGIKDSLSLSFNEINIPENINVYILDNISGYEHSIHDVEELSIITDSIGVIDLESITPVSRYLNYGNHRYFISFQNTMLSNNYNQLVPKSYQLFQNYPNPFNPETNIMYNLPKRQFVNITIYDMLGHEVRTLVNQIQEAGLNNIRWLGLNNNSEKLSSGVYLYSITTENFKKTKKMLLLK